MSSECLGLCSSHQILESEEENNYFVPVKVELVEHLEELPIKEEPIEEEKSPQTTFSCDLCDKTPDARVYHMCPDCGRQFLT